MQEKVDNSNWRANVAEVILNWVDPIDLYKSVGAIHYPFVDHPVNNWEKWCVWFGNKYSKNIGVYMHDTCDRLIDYTARCDHDDCGKYAYTHISKGNQRYTFWLSCFEIAHDNGYWQLFMS